MKLKTMLLSKEIKLIQEAITDGIQRKNHLSPKSALAVISMVIHQQPNLTKKMIAHVKKLAKKDAIK